MEDDTERIDELEMKNSKVESIAVLMDIAKSVCKIQYISKESTIINGTGFFIKLETSDHNRPLYCIMTNEHVITRNVINSNIEIEVIYDNQHEHLILILDNNRFIRIYDYLNIDAVIIEIKPEEVDKKYFLLPNINLNEGYEDLKNQLITIVQFPEGKDLNYSVGKIIDINEISKEIMHKSGTKKGSSGSPIFIKESRNVLGIHKQGNIKKLVNYGNLIKPILDSIKLELKYEKIKYNGNEYEGEYSSNIKDGQGKINYENKEFYIGKWEDYKKQGKGVLYRQKNKIKYIGEFFEDQYDGNGKLIEENGDYYIGQFIGGYKFGEGKEFNKNNELIYEGSFAYGKYEGSGKKIINKDKNWYFYGQFEDGKMKGKGQIFIKNKIIFEGEFDNNQMVGNGKYFYLNGQYYIGQLKDYKREGKGTIFNEDNTIEYEGEFIADKKNGKGKYYIKDGSYYIGEFKDDEMDGKGKIYDKEGNILFDGCFLKGLKEGEGTVTMKDYSFFGKFKDDKFDGEGLMIYEDGDEYEGEFKNGVKDGKGKFSSKDYIYEGTYLNNKKHGQGIIYKKDDIDKKNPIYNGNFVNDVYEGKGKLKLKTKDEDDLYYEGEFKNGKKHGEGKIFDKYNKIIYDGHFVDDEYEGENEKHLFEDGGYYLGQFKNGKCHGKGVIYDENNEVVYEGDFINGKEDGFGTLYFSLEEIDNKKCYYIGQFKNGEYNGKGDIYLVEGNIKLLEGNYVNGKLNGKARIFYGDKAFKEIEFEEGKSISEAVIYIKDNGIVKFFEKLGNKLMKLRRNVLYFNHKNLKMIKRNAYK